MENVVLIVHLILALSLIGVVLLQRSEGGGLGMGGGGAMTGRSAATALGKVTWGLAIAFIATSVTLTIIAAEKAAGGSVVDGLTDLAPESDSGTAPDLGLDLLPPGAAPEAPLVPQADSPTPDATTPDAPAADAPAADAPAEAAPAEPAPASEAPTTDAPADPAPAVEAPAVEAPAAVEPATEEPAPAAPASQ